MLVSATDSVAAALGSTLDGLALRQRVAADNIANIDTPGLTAATLDFESSLRSALADGEMAEFLTHNGLVALSEVDTRRLTLHVREQGAMPAAVGTDATEPVDPIESRATLATIQVPALVVVGELDMIDFRRGAETIARHLPHANHVVIAGTKHLAPLEQPEQFRELLLRFLSEHSRR